jgi:hypothetical protein
VELPEGGGERLARWHGDGVAVEIRSAGAYMRPGKERRGGDGVLGVRLRWRTRGE